MKKFNQFRYTLNIHFEDLPSNIEKSDNCLFIVKDMYFYTLQEIADFTKMTYQQINDIYRKRNKKYTNKNPFIPNIRIERINY